MRVVRNKDVSAKADVRIPPGAHVSRFYREGLTASTSGRDMHPTGAQLIKVAAILNIPSTSGPVTLSMKKNGEDFKDVEIPEGDFAVVVELELIENGVDMGFEGLADYLQVEVVEVGVNAAQLTVLGIFDR